jgi:hypothetical protein
MNLPSELQHLYSPNRNINNGTYYVVPIEESIPYKVLKTGDFTEYELYINHTNQKEHSVENFKELIKDWGLTKLEKVVVCGWDHSTYFWTLDGGHRLSIFKYKQLFGDTIPLEYITINYDTVTIELMKTALRNTVNRKKYNGWENRTEFGYHSFRLFNIDIRGQRDPVKRFEKIKKFYDFKGKTVLDLGCNTGGMLFHIPEIAKGVGVDYDSNCISACNMFKERFNFSCDLEFYEKDLNAVNITNFCKLNNCNPDIVFLLSLGSWVQNWKTLYTDVWNVTNCILLETNNDTEGRPQLDLFTSFNAIITLVSDKSDDDCTGNMLRKTYLIQKS